MFKKKITKFLLIGSFAFTGTAGIIIPTVITSNLNSLSVSIEKNSEDKYLENNQNRLNTFLHQSVVSTTIAVADQSPIYYIPIDYSLARDDTSLNKFLSNKYNVVNSQQVFEESFQNKNQFKNVSISYVENSADYKNQKFQIKVVPLKNYYWNDGSNNEKIIDVTISYIDDRSWTLSIPENLVYNQTITLNDARNQNEFNNYLSKNFDVSKLSEKLDNLDIRLYPNSASYEKGTFKILLTPINGYAWVNGRNSTEAATVKIKEMQYVKKDAEYPTSDTYKVTLTLDKAWNNRSFDSYLSANFKVSDMAKKSSYKNVTVQYVANSADYDKNEFKILITANKDHEFKYYNSIFAFKNDSKTQVLKTVKANINKNYSSYNTNSLGKNADNVFKGYNKPFIYLTNNTNSSITYAVTSWQFAPGKLTNVSYWKTYWSLSTDGGKSFGVVGQNGSAITFNKKIIPANNPKTKTWLLRYEVLVHENQVWSYNPTSFSKLIYVSNPVAILD